MGKLEELKAKMAEAIKTFQANGDMAGIQAVSKEMDRAKSEIAKSEATRLQAEAVALAGKREQLAASIHNAIRGIPGTDKQLAEVKAWGFTYKVDRANPNEPDITYKSVSLTTAVIKARKGSNGGGAGKSKDEYGISLSEIVDKYGTPEELAAIGSADSNSKSWQLKQAVKKRVIASGELAPVK